MPVICLVCCPQFREGKVEIASISRAAFDKLMPFYVVKQSLRCCLCPHCYTGKLTAGARACMATTPLRAVPGIALHLRLPSVCRRRLQTLPPNIEREERIRHGGALRQASM